MAKKDTSPKPTSSASSVAPAFQKQEEQASDLAEKLEQGTLSPVERNEIAQLLRSANIVVTSSTREIFSGPLPPAELLNQYSANAQKIILEMAQHEQSHAHQMQRQGLEGAIKKDRRGQYLGGLVALAGSIELFRSTSLMGRQSSRRRAEISGGIGVVGEYTDAVIDRVSLREITLRPF